MNDSEPIVFIDIRRIKNARKTKLPNKPVAPSWWTGPCVATTWEIELENKQWFRVYLLPWCSEVNRCIIENNNRVAIDIRDNFEGFPVKVIELIDLARESIENYKQKCAELQKKPRAYPLRDIRLPLHAIKNRDDDLKVKKEKEEYNKRLEEGESAFIDAKLLDQDDYVGPEPEEDEQTKILRKLAEENFVEENVPVVWHHKL
jgi:hypothetical protein